MPEAELTREITKCIEETLRENRRIEHVLIILLVAISGTGLGLLIAGAISGNGSIAWPGSLCELAIAMPIRFLIRLRQENIRLSILPQLIRMADRSSEKKLVMKFVDTLIGQIGP